MEVPLLIKIKIKRLEIYFISSLFCSFKTETRIRCEKLQYGDSDSKLDRLLTVTMEKPTNRYYSWVFPSEAFR